VLAHPDIARCCTAVGQVLAFSLMALGPPGERREHGREARELAMQNLKIWKVDYEMLLRSIPVAERQPPPSSSAFEPTTYSAVDRSPYPLRTRGGGKKKAVAAADDPDANIIIRDRSPEPSDNEEDETRTKGQPGTPHGRAPAQRAVVPRDAPRRHDRL